MANLSNLPDNIARIQDYEYLYASNTNVSNFISVKLSGYGNYDLWKTQMLCLMEAHEMCWLVDESTPKDLSKKIIKKYDSLLKGWIFGSVSEDVLRFVVNPTYSAKDVWGKLISSFDQTMSSKQERHANSTPAKVDTVAKSKNNMALGETSTTKEGIESAKSDEKGEEATQIETKDSALTKEDTTTKIEDNTTAFGETTSNDEGNDSEVKGEDATKKETKGNFF
ncbi:uncharacterized protein LOC143616983 [Bidens hawaiensis]|uniref:uncharacterized protein LOC143616983 n=1 Tax=Bidens hawaiensis TaxID=980011 RepID=UPI0040494BB6